MNALMTMWKRPSVRMYSGIEIICTIGLMTALTRPKITATTKMMATLARVVSPPTKRMPETMSVTTHNATPVTAARRRNPMRSVCRTQQVGVHDPAVPRACVGAQFGDRGAHLPYRARHQQLVGHAQIGAPPDAGRREALLKRTVAVEHHHGAPRESVAPQLPAGGDEHTFANVVERDAMSRRERLDSGDAGDDVVVDVDVGGHGVQDAQSAVVERRVPPREEGADAVGRQL